MVQVLLACVQAWPRRTEHEVVWFCTMHAEAPQWAVQPEEAWARREVQLSVVPGELADRGGSLDGLPSLLATLREEERSAFADALQAATDACVRTRC